MFNIAIFLTGLVICILVLFEAFFTGKVPYTRHPLIAVKFFASIGVMVISAIAMMGNEP